MKKTDRDIKAVKNQDPPDCPHCGMAYKDFKTGLYFGDVKDLLWVADDDPSRWKHKRRHTVLGLWYQIKRSMWQDHVELCGDTAAQSQYMDDLAKVDFAY